MKDDRTCEMWSCHGRLHQKGPPANRFLQEMMVTGSWQTVAVCGSCYEENINLKILGDTGIAVTVCKEGLEDDWVVQQVMRS